jgi:hypothetical protein
MNGVCAGDIVKATLEAKRLSEAERKRQEELSLYEVQAKLNEEWFRDFKKIINLERSQEDFAKVILNRNMVIPIFPCDHWISTCYGSDRLYVPMVYQNYFKQLGKHFGFNVDLKVYYEEKWHGGGDDMVSTDHYKSSCLIFSVE